MKLVPVLLLLFFTAAAQDITEVRQQYIRAAVSEGDAERFHASMQQVPDNATATLLAYKAAATILLAKYESGLFDKSSIFNKGKKMLEAVIEKYPGNYEARLLRLNIQDNVPWITGYTSDIKKDKAFLLKHFGQQDEALKAYTKKYILQSDAFSESEKAAIK